MTQAARLRKVGGSVMLAIPKPMLDALELTPNSAVSLSVRAGKLVVDPKTRRRYSRQRIAGAMQAFETPLAMPTATGLRASRPDESLSDGAWRHLSRLARSTIGHEQQGKRPVLVISPGRFNRLTGVPVVLPIATVGNFARARRSSASRLIATYDAGCFACRQPMSDTAKPAVRSKIADGRDRQYDWHASQPIESSGRDYEYGPLALLLVTYGGIERDEIDVATLHQISSRRGRLARNPVAVGMRAAFRRLALAQQFAERITSARFWIDTSFPALTERLTAEFGVSSSASSIGLGIASITDPPTCGAVRLESLPLPFRNYILI